MTEQSPRDGRRPPSFFETDRLGLTLASGESPSAGEEARIRSNPHCAAHLKRIQVEPVVPGWVRALEEPPSAERRRRLSAWGWLSFAGIAAVAMVAVLAVDGRSGRYTAKGTAGVAVHINRNGEVWLWDSTSKLEVGDKIRLEVKPAGHRFVGVYTGGVKTRDELVPLYVSSLPEEEKVALPKAWEIDGTRTSERLTIWLGDTKADVLPEGRASSRRTSIEIELQIRRERERP